MISGLIREHGAQVLVTEEGFSRGRSSQLLHRLLGIAQLAAAQAGIPHLSLNVSSARLRVLGRGNATKDDVIAWCQAGGNEPATDDEADARLLLAGLVVGRRQVPARKLPPSREESTSIGVMRVRSMF